MTVAYRLRLMRTASPLTVIIVDGDMEHAISLNHVTWFQGRGISEKTLEAIGIYSGRHHQSGDSFTVEPDPEGKVLVFPYLNHGVEVNAKYRGTGKRFYQKPNGTKTFWNSDVLDDPCLKDGSVSLVITEGEMDALSVLEAGIPYVVSVPDGAPPTPSGYGGTCPPNVVPPGCAEWLRRGELDIDEEPEHDTKYGYIFNNWQRLLPIRRIIIATDSDAPGRRLAEEMVRRLGRVRCQFVSYPVECKDLNEVLVKYGAEKVNEVLRHAQPYSISGIYTYSELPPEPDFVPLTSGWGRLDQFLRPYYPAFMVVTGIAGSGKTTWVNQMVAQMSILHNVGVAIASFEMRIKPFVSDVFLNTYKELRGVHGAEEWLENNVVFISPEPNKDDSSFDVDWLIERATAAVIRYGSRILVIDPWNEIEHAHRKFESQTEYISRAIKALKGFGRQFEVLVIVVAHPSKSGAEKAAVYHKGQGADQIPTNEITLYDISDSAHFSNKADIGIVIHRISGSFITDVMIKKVRYQSRNCQPGSATLVYDPDTGTFGQ